MKNNITKVHLSRLSLILGTQCNLKCSHCLGGNPKSMIMQPKYIDAIIDNITGIDELQFIGHEVSLYVDTLKMVVQKLIDAGIRVNYIVIYTNAAVCSQELVDVFSNFRFNHTAHPEKAVIQFSTDKYHFNIGFTKDKLNQNIKKYQDNIGDCDYRYMSLGNGLYIMGRSKELKLDDIADIDNVLVPSLNGHHYAEFREKCNGDECNSGQCVCNCIVSDIILLPNGYVYNHDSEAFNALGSSDYSSALGHIELDSLYNMINNYIEKYRDIDLPIDIVVKSSTYYWHTQELLFNFLKFKKAILKSVESNNLLTCILSSNEMINKLDALKEYIDTHSPKDDEDLEYYKSISDRISREIELISAVIQQCFGFGRYLKDVALTLIKHIYSISPFSEDNLKRNVGIDFDNFDKLWKCYEECDFDNYKMIAQKIIRENKGVTT